MQSISIRLALVLALASPAAAQTVKSSWSAAKNATADNVYNDNDRTLYCGCTYKSDNDSDGSGTVELAACNMEAISRYVKRAKKMEWEHIVPASLMPARQMSCWTNPGQFEGCAGKSGRKCCETVKVAQNMIWVRLF